MASTIDANTTPHHDAPLSKKTTQAKSRPRSFEPSGQGVEFERVYTTQGVHPFDEVEWEQRDASITNERGEAVFEQAGVEFPASWSQMATNVVVSKYFRGKVGTPEREHSVKQLISRVVDTITDWGIQDNVFSSPESAEAFRDELTYLILHQKMAFNSPVWFNVGVEESPQASACFINSVEDTMGDIMDLAKTECMLFKWGSGAGSNLSSLRSSKEHLSGGGQASGPVSFMRGYDAFAGAIKCVTGETLVWTDQGAVPIVEARGLIATGKGMSPISEFHVNSPKPVHGIQLSHTGLSVRGTDNHPIMTFTDEGIVWKNLGEIQPGDAVAVSRGHWSSRQDATIEYTSSINEAYRKKDYVLPGRMSPELGTVLGLLCAEGSIEQNRVRFTNGDEQTVSSFVDAWKSCFGYAPEPRFNASKNCWDVSSHCVDIVRLLAKMGIASPSRSKVVPREVMASSEQTARAFLRGYFEGDGHNGRDVFAVSGSKTLRDQIQQMLLALGHLCSAYTTTHGFFGVRMSGEAARKFRDEIGFISQRKVNWYTEELEGNTNVDVIPGLVDAVRDRSQGFGWYEMSDGSKEQLKFGFFNRRGEVSTRWLKDNPATLESLKKISSTLYDGVMETLEFGFFWDRVGQTWIDEPEPTYDITVPGEHSFVGNGIICHNSGGKTRRAAKMVILNDDHPDVVDFVESKANEERKAWALIEQGYDGGFNVPGGAYDSVYFQNANHSVRVSDAFMQAVVEDKPWTTRAVTDGAPVETMPAGELMAKIADAAWICGDPGMQYDSTINAWHTCKQTDRIYASNPCVTGDTLVATSKGWQRIDALLEDPFEVIGGDGELHTIEAAFRTGVKPVYRMRTRAGFELKLTADHRVWTKNRGDVPASELTLDDAIELGRPAFGDLSLDEAFAEYVGLMLGDGCITGEQRAAVLTLSPQEGGVAEAARLAVQAWQAEHARDGREARDVNVNQPQATLRMSTSSRCIVEALDRWAVLDSRSVEKRLTPEAMRLDQPSAAALLRGLFTADGTVANYSGKSHYVSLESTSQGMLQQVQLMLLSFGIRAKIYTDRRPLGQTMALLPDGKGGRKEYPIEQLHSLRISKASRVRFEQAVNFMSESTKRAQLADLSEHVQAYNDPMIDYLASIEFVGEEEVFDLTEPNTDHFVANGVVVHNCSEYLFLDDTACNLASLNLLTYRDAEGDFDVERFAHACRVTITAQEILVPNASYPTPQIEKNSHAFRPLGLGFTNLGALLMVRGVPYDSQEGRALSGAITALMCGEAYAQSARLAEALGPFSGYPINEASMLEVIGMHRDSVEAIAEEHAPITQDPIWRAARSAWERAYALGEEHGYRNAQATVLAPTGTISFLMDCDTTGIEPDIALIKYKKLVGGGYFKMINSSVPEALTALGYSDSEREAITAYLSERDTVEGAPHLKPEHLSVFDCAFVAAHGTRSIEPMGHVRMMAACQPFLSGAISKTVNLPSDATREDIAQVYVDAWKLGLKAVAIYRDGCKRTQPLSTTLDDGNGPLEELLEAAEEVMAVAEPQIAREVQPSSTPVVAARGAQNRRRLPNERPSITHKFSIAGHEGYITVGMYQDGQPGEIFVVMSKEGSVVSGLMDSFATSISLCLQYGVPLEVLVDKFSFSRFEPSGFTDNPRIRIAHSITDYLFRWLADKFMGEQQKSRYFSNLEGDASAQVSVSPEEVIEALGETQRAGQVSAASHAEEQDDSSVFEDAPAGSVVYEAPSSSPFSMQADAPPCHVCGGITIRAGACYSCPNCGATTGCG